MGDSLRWDSRGSFVLYIHISKVTNTNVFGFEVM